MNLPSLQFSITQNVKSWFFLAYYGLLLNFCQIYCKGLLNIFYKNSNTCICKEMHVLNTFSITLNTFEYIFNLDHELGSLATYIWGIISTIQKKLVESFLCFLNVLTSKWCIHSSEIRGLYFMKCSHEILFKICYFDMRTPWRFS